MSKKTVLRSISSTKKTSLIWLSSITFFCMLTLLKIDCKYCFSFDYKDIIDTKKVRSKMISEPLNIYLDL